MAGTVDIVLRCLTGMRARGGALRFDPALPPEVKSLRFSVHYRGHRLDVTLAEDQVTISSRPGVADRSRCSSATNPSSCDPAASTSSR